MGTLKILVLSLTIMALNASQLKGGITNRCKYSCGNYINLFEENITFSSIDKQSVKVSFSSVSSDLPIYIMSRQKYWHVIEHNYGPKAKSLGKKFLHPEIEEARQWVDNNKCKIGKVCAPNSDCWGSGSDVCYSDSTDEWVSGKAFNYLNMWWTTEWRETCTLDWECKIIFKKTPIHYNSEGEMFIVLDDEKIRLNLRNNEQMIHRKTYNVFIPKLPKESSITITLECFKHKNVLLCEGVNEEMIKFDQGTRCTVLGPTKYCLIEGEFNRIRDFGANLYASVADLNQIRDAFVVNQERDNYNNYILTLKIKKIQKILLDLIASLSETNPQILNQILKGKFFVRHLTNWVYEICSCEDSLSCEMKEFHSNNIRYCGEKVNSKQLHLFDVNKTLDYTVDDVFKFQGKDINMIDVIEEEELKESEFSREASQSNFWGGVLKTFDVLEWFSASVGYIALVIAVLAYVKK